MSPCAGLNMALKGAQEHNFSTALFIQPGNYYLDNQTENSFMNVTGLALIGNSSVPGESIIHCNSSAGLNFTELTGAHFSLAHVHRLWDDG